MSDEAICDGCFGASEQARLQESTRRHRATQPALSMKGTRAGHAKAFGERTRPKRATPLVVRGGEGHLVLGLEGGDAAQHERVSDGVQDRSLAQHVRRLLLCDDPRLRRF